MDISDMKKKDIEYVKLIVFDVDGVLVPRGTKITQEEGITSLETKKIPEHLIAKVKKLHDHGFIVNISSGRGLYMLQDMFRTILDYVSLTFENGSATWYEGRIIQHVNSYSSLKDIMSEMLKISHSNIKGFEPKECIITIHTSDRVPEIEKIAEKYDKLYCLWNGEAYDIGIKKIQTKAVGVEALMKLFDLEKKNVMVIGDNLNDREMVEKAGVRISADKTRLEGDFYVPLEGEKLPGEALIDRINEIIA